MSSANSEQERIDAARSRYIEHFEWYTMGFECEVEEPCGADEWEQFVNDAIEFNEPVDFTCEGVLDDEDLAEIEKLSVARKERIRKAKIAKYGKIDT